MIILGAGQMAQHHARAIARTALPARIVAVCDPSPSGLNAMRDIAPKAVQFTSLEEALSEQFADIVHICTPPNTHEALTETALRANCHVYVEKPFVESVAAARRLLDLANTRGLKLCAGHQLLYERPTLRANELLPTLGQLTHVESFFSFRAVKRNPDGRIPLREDLQLLDILPHPVYLLLDFLWRSATGSTELAAVEIGPAGTVHALVRRGPLTGTLVVTLEGRPVESYIRLVGTNGLIHADYVRGTVQRQIGPGVSGVDKLLSPYRSAWQLFAGTTRAMGRRVLKRQRNYPGLAEIFAAFYHSVRTGAESPVPPERLVETVEICERVASALMSAYSSPPPSLGRGRCVVVTGGTGFLGKEVVRILRERGEQVRVLARRDPPGWDRIPGVDYRAADLAQPLGAEVLEDAEAVIHCAAETAGGWDQHQKNSIESTEHLLRAAAQAGVRRCIHVSSISVMAVPSAGAPLAETSSLAADSKSSGPYAWGKIESERLAQQLCGDLAIHLRIVRPAALVDYQHFEPPGLLGKRVGNLFVAVGRPTYPLGVVSVTFSAQTIAWILRHFDEAPGVLHLLEPRPPSKAQLVERLRESNPDLTVVWLPMIVLAPLSWLAIALQKLLRPKHPAVNIARVFAPLKYDTARIAALEPRIMEYIQGNNEDHLRSVSTAITSPLRDHARDSLSQVR